MPKACVSGCASSIGSVYTRRDWSDQFGRLGAVSDAVGAIWQAAFGVARPGKIICVGRNYRAHAGEEGAELPSAPLLFAKFANTIIGNGEPIGLPPDIGHVDAEAELAVVIGSTARCVAVEDALGVVAGYTVANDVSAREAQFADGQWFRGKGFDTFCPILPDFTSQAEIGDGRGLRVTQRLNGELLQDASTDDLIFDVPTLVAYSSSVCTLDPGDLILTGTPAGVGYFRDPPISIKSGDVVEVAIEGLGVLSNPAASARLER
jgi:2-keto-4-pentenoate hydratase/2-oxohepta-3-ene-1,7-dioic acid hydratase in catechol pathway